MKKLILLVGFTLFVFTAYAQLDSGKFGFDGPVNTIVKYGSKIYIGGNFNAVGYRTGTGAVFSIKTSLPYLNFPLVDGHINTTASDGHGGWYIGGNFSKVGDSVRQNLAHILTDGSIAIWKPNPQFEVKALKVRGDTVFCGGTTGIFSLGPLTVNCSILDKKSASILPDLPASDNYLSTAIPDGNKGWYVGGMATLGNSTVNGLAHIDSTGKVLQGGSLDFGQSTVRTLELSDSTLYVGGSFTKIYSRTSAKLARISVSTALSNLNIPKIYGDVYCMAADGKGGVYIGGSFSQIGDSMRKNFAQIDSTGVVTGLDIEPNNYVSAIKLSGGIGYIGGKFTQVSDNRRFSIAAFDLKTGKITSWNPGGSTIGWVNAIEAFGDTIYAGGIFSNLGGKSCLNIAAVSATSAKSLNLTLYLDGEVRTLCLNNGKLYFGGNFTYVNSTKQPYLGAMDIVSELVTPWNPVVNADVNTIVTSGAKMYVGGNFYVAGSVNHQYIIETDTAKGKVSSWAPTLYSAVKALNNYGSTLYAGSGGLLYAYDLGSHALSSWNPGFVGGEVNAIIANSTNVFIGGTFLNAGGFSVNYLTSINTKTWKLNPWSPNPNSGITQMHKSGGLLYISGYFSQIGSTTRNYMAAIDISTAKATSWNPAPNNLIDGFIIGKSTIFAYGLFTGIGGKSYSYLAAIDSSSGNANTWNPAPNGEVVTSQMSGNNLYIGGNFTKIGTQSTAYLGCIDISTSKPTSWSPAPDKQIKSMVLTDSTLYISGSFTKLGTVYVNNLAAVNTRTGVYANWDANATGYSGPDQMISGPGRIFAIGGHLTNPTRNYFMIVDGKTGNFMVPDYGFNGEVDALEIMGNRLYIGGKFLRTAAYVRNYLAAIDLPTLKIASWNPVADNNVYKLVSGNGKVFAYGDFSSIGSTSISKLASIDGSTGKVISWDSKFYGTVFNMYLKDSTLYVGGYDILRAGGGSRIALLALSTNTAQLRPLDPKFKSSDRVYSINSIGKNLYLGGALYASSYSNTKIISIDSGTGKLTSFFSNTNGYVYSLSISGDTLFAGGNLTIAGATLRNNLAMIDADSMKISSWVPGYLNSPVNTLAINTGGDTLFANGGKEYIFPNNYYYLAAISTSTGALTALHLKLDSQITGLTYNRAILYVCGKFSKTNSTSVRGAFAMYSKSLSAYWNANTGGGGRIRSIAASRYVMCAGGNFSNIGGVSQAYIQTYPSPYGNAYSSIYAGDSLTRLMANYSNIFAFGTIGSFTGIGRNCAASFNSSLNWNSWNSNTNGIITAAAFSPKAMYLSGYFDNVWSQSRYRLAAVDTVTGKPTAWQAPVYLHSPLTGMAVTNNMLFGIEDQNVIIISLCEAKMLLSGNTVCAGSNGKITITKSYSGAKYTLYLNGKSTGASVTGTGDTVSISVPAKYLTQAKTIFTISAIGTSCGSQAVQDTVSILTNIIKTNYHLRGGTFCSGNAIVSVIISQTGIIYDAYLGSTKLASATAKDTLGVLLSIPTSSLKSGDNAIFVKATKTGCGSQQLHDSALVRFITSLTQTNIITGDTVCSGSDGVIKIANVDPGVNYQIGSLSVNGQSANGGNITLTIPAASLNPGIDTFSVTASSKTCSTVIEKSKATVMVAYKSSHLGLTTTSNICGSLTGTI
jgi:hypothetical protein